MRKETLALRPSTSAPRGKNISLEQHYAGLMRASPAFIIAGCEASESIVDLFSEESVYEENQAGPEKPTVVGPEELTVVGPRTGPTLEAPAVAGGGVKGKGKVLQWKFVCARQTNATNACMVGVRESWGEEINCLYQEEILHGDYRDGTKKLKPSRSAVFIAGVKLRHKVAILPQEVVVMVLHFHCVCAKGEKGFRAEHDKLLLKIPDLFKQYKVNIFITDANMAMLQVVHTVRSRGLYIDVAAWLPWKTEEGRRGMDSMFMAFIDAPGEHTPVSKGWENAWEIGHRMKILPTGVECLDGTKYSGCGQLNASYRLPHGMNFEQAFATFIKPSIDPESDEMQEHVRSCGRSAELRNLNKHDAGKYKGGHFRTRELRSSWLKTCYLKASAVADAGQLAHGIHYPLFVLGKMPCDRGEAGKKNRSNKALYGGAVGWKAEMDRRVELGGSADSSTSTWGKTGKVGTWGSPSRGWNAASAVTDNASNWSSLKNRAMQAPAVADNASDWSTWKDRVMQAPAVADTGYPPVTTRGRASNDTLQDHGFFANPGESWQAEIEWAE